MTKASSLFLTERVKQRDPQFKLRIPEPLKESLEKSAAKNHRSLSSEILFRLVRSVTNEEPQS
jgi:hypothetical protein